MLKVKIQDTQAHLSSLLDKKTVKGEPFIVTANGRPVAMVTPYTTKENRSRRIGFLKGKVTVPEDFDHMGMDEIASAFDGKQ